MKNIIIIGSLNSGKKNNPIQIADSIRSEDIVINVVYWEDLVFSISTSNIEVEASGINIINPKPDLIIALGWYKNGKKSIYRDVAFSLALVLKNKGIKFWNSEMGSQRSMTKLSCMVQLALDGISVPTTYFSLDKKLIASKLQYPFIAKAAGASRGEMNYLIKNNEDIAMVLESDAYFIVQPYLINDHDLRIICFDGEPALILKRSRKQGANTHLNNVSQGADASWLELSDVPADLLTLSHKICIITGREMAGIDFIPDTLFDTGYSCLEVNAIPQLTSGTDSEKKMAALANTIKNIKGE